MKAAVWSCRVLIAKQLGLPAGVGNLWYESTLRIVHKQIMMQIWQLHISKFIMLLVYCTLFGLKY